MKNKLVLKNSLHFLCISLFLIPFVLFSQITIERSDYTREIGVDADSWMTEDKEVAVPTEGANQIWDYSNLELVGSYFRFFEAATHPDIPAANAVGFSTIKVYGLVPLEYAFYSVLDEEKQATLGRHAGSGSASLDSISQNPNDTLTFLERLDIYEEPIYDYKFPINYNDSWNSNLTLNLSSELTVEGFDLDHVPGKFTTYINYKNTVVGYGTLLLPHPNGNGTVSQEALLIKRERTLIDSIFLNGQPAPPPLLSAFNLEQGRTYKTLAYTFVAKNLPNAALEMNIIDSVATNIFMSDGVKDFTSAIFSKQQDFNQLSLSPNPVIAGGMITIKTQIPISGGYVLLSDISGKIIQELPFNTTSNRQFSIQLPSAIGQGFFIYQVYDRKGQAIGKGKLLVN